MIYAIEAVGLERIKIGKAASPKTRKNELQTGSPVPLRILFSLDWHDSNEKILHAFFAEERVLGEWFEVGPKVKEFLRIVGQCDLGEDKVLEEERFYSWMDFMCSEARAGRAQEFTKYIDSKTTKGAGSK